MTSAAITYPNEFNLKLLKPMALKESILLFGIPAALLAVSLWWMRPALTQAGVPDFVSYTFSLTIVNVGLLVAAVVGYVHEGNPLNWTVHTPDWESLPLDDRRDSTLRRTRTTHRADGARHLQSHRIRTSNVHHS